MPGRQRSRQPSAAQVLAKAQDEAASDLRTRCERYINDPNEARWLELRAARWRYDKAARS